MSTHGPGHVAAPPPSPTSGEGAEADKLRGQDPMEALLKKYFDPGALLQYQQIEHANKYQPGNKLKAVFTQLQRMFENAKAVFQNPDVSEEKKQEVAKKLEEAVNRYGNRTHKQPWELMLSAVFNQRPIGALLGTIIKLLVAYLYTSRKTRNLADELEALRAAGPGLTTDPDALRRAGVDVVSDPNGETHIRDRETDELMTPEAYTDGLRLRHAEAVAEEARLGDELVAHGATSEGLEAGLAVAAGHPDPVGPEPTETAPLAPSPAASLVGAPDEHPTVTAFDGASAAHTEAEADADAAHSLEMAAAAGRPRVMRSGPPSSARALSVTDGPTPSEPRSSDGITPGM